MTGTDFFCNHNLQTITCTCHSSTYSPNPCRREGAVCGFTLSRSHSCCTVRLVYTQISSGHIWTTLYLPSCPGVRIFWGAGPKHLEWSNRRLQCLYAKGSWFVGIVLRKGRRENIITLYLSLKYTGNFYLRHSCPSFILQNYEVILTGNASLLEGQQFHADWRLRMYLVALR